MKSIQYLFTFVVCLAYPLTGCGTPTPAGEDGKCFSGDPASGTCAEGLYCLTTRGADGQPVMEKVSFNKTSAVGKCQKKSPLGGACTENPACAEGVCQWKNPDDEEGLCVATK